MFDSRCGRDREWQATRSYAWENCHSESYVTEEITKLIVRQENKSSANAAMQYSGPTSWNSILACVLLKRDVSKISCICSIIILPAEMRCANYTGNDSLCTIVSFNSVRWTAEEANEVISHRLYCWRNSIVDALNRFVFKILLEDEERAFLAFIFGIMITDRVLRKILRAITWYRGTLVERDHDNHAPTFAFDYCIEHRELEERTSSKDEICLPPCH
jgi:hypothetical protein